MAVVLIASRIKGACNTLLGSAGPSPLILSTPRLFRVADKLIHLAGGTLYAEMAG